MNIGMDFEQLSEDYGRIEMALNFLAEHSAEQPGLKEVAESIGLSEYHFQRLFSRWVGISPKRFLQYLTKEQAVRLLEASHDLLDVTYATGLSSPGRLHDLLVNCEAVTPGEYRRRGEGLTISFGFHPTPFGECLLASTERGICSLAFIDSGNRTDAYLDLSHRWPRARLQEAQEQTRPLVEKIFAGSSNDGEPLSLHVQGTNFQIKVWEALLQVPSGNLVSYADLAGQIGMPKAVQAVGQAVGSNPIPVLIPCHRVIRKLGEFGGYRYGTARKMALLGWELAHQSQQ